MEFGRTELIWAVINFAIFAAVMTWLLYKPVLKLLDSRAEEIEGRLSRAEKARVDAEDIRRRLEAQLAQAEAQARDILNKAAQQAEADREQVVGQAREEAERLIEKARATITREKERAIAELREEVAGLATMAAGKIIGKALSAEDHKQLVDQVVAQMGEHNS